MFTRIVLASDGSDDALSAAKTAAGLARQFDAEILVVYVSGYPDNAPVFDGTAAESSEPDASASPVARLALEETLNAVDRTKAVLAGAVSPSNYSIREYIGDPADTILRVAEQMQADLILLGSGGMGGVRSLLLGSVSAKVARHAHCSVLIVRAGNNEEIK